MTKSISKRGRFTLEFKQEAARLVESGQSQAAVSRSLGVVEQTLGNWVRENRAGSLKGATSKPKVTAEQMEVSRLRAELARVTMERDILGKATAYFAKCQK
jgi:transposase